MKSLLPSVFIVLWLVFVLQVPAVEASNQWCDSDPIILIKTPAGHLVPVYVDVGAQNLLYVPNTFVSSTLPTYTAVPTADGGATRVSVVVSVPSVLGEGAFATRQIVSTGPFGTGMVYAQTAGVSGKPMTATFRLQSP